MKAFLLSLCLVANVFALGQVRYVETVNARGGFPLVQAKAAAVVYVDSADHAGVVRDASIAGAIGKSALIDRLIREGKIDASQITGKWEAEHFTRKIDAGSAGWDKIDDYGRTVSAMPVRLSVLDGGSGPWCWKNS